MRCLNHVAIHHMSIRIIICLDILYDKWSSVMNILICSRISSTDKIKLVIAIGFFIIGRIKIRYARACKVNSRLLYII
jgi:hypothetical protein